MTSACSIDRRRAACSVYSPVTLSRAAVLWRAPRGRTVAASFVTCSWRTGWRSAPLCARNTFRARLAAASSRASALPCVKAGRRSLPVLHARWLACAHTWGNSPTLTSSSASTSSATVFRLQSSGRAGSTTVVRPSGRTSATSICGVRQPDGCLTPLCTST